MSLKDIDFKNTKVAFEHYDSAKLRKTYLIFALMNQNWLVNIGTFFIKIFLNLRFPIKNVIKVTIFEHFCGGENISECEKTIEHLHQYKIGTILDYSVEGEDNEEDFEKTKNEIIETIYYAAKNHEKIPFSVFKVSGIASTDLLEKFQKNPNTLNGAEKLQFQKVRDRVEQICTIASNEKVRIFFDAEETWIQDAIDDLCLEMMEKFNKNNTILYNTYQLYRTAGYPNLKKHFEIASAKNFKIGAKLVRGAYMEKERKRANDNNYIDPINPTKKDTDIEFDKAMTFCLDNLNTISICLGTHNENSCRKCIEIMKAKGLDVGHEGVYFAQLLGMSDNISFNLAKSGFNVAKYVPYGPIEAVMPYLFRRAEENTSIAGQTGREFGMIKEELQRRKKNE
jgi:proline dehydrogenase